MYYLVEFVAMEHWLRLDLAGLIQQYGERRICTKPWAGRHLMMPPHGILTGELDIPSAVHHMEPSMIVCEKVLASRINDLNLRMHVETAVF